jgi:excisionase family DNA binding protein
MQLLSKTEAAKVLGVSRQAIYDAIKTGRLSVVETADGRSMIASETMREEWAKSTQTRIGVGPSRDTGVKQLRSREERMAAPRITKTNEAIPDYDESRARTEHLKAELLELERKQKEGLLVPAADVEAKWVEIVVLARTKIMGIPTKAKQRIPDLDVDAIGVLDEIVRETLEDLASEAEDDDE